MKIFEDELVITTKVALEPLRFAGMYYLAESATVDVWKDELNHTVTRLMAEVMTEHIVDLQEVSVSASVEFPHSPWQFFKQNHASSWWLGWLVRRRPVVLDTKTNTNTAMVEFHRTTKFPHSSNIPSTLGQPYIFETAEVSYLTKTYPSAKFHS